MVVRFRDLHRFATIAAPRILAFLPEQRSWLDTDVHIFDGTHKLRYWERMRIARFLVGNGCDPTDIYNTFAGPRLGNQGNHTHFNSVINDAMSKKYDSKWYYFDVHKQDYLFLGGEPNLSRSPPQPLVRKFNAWEKEVQRVLRKEGRFPTHCEQDAFFA